MTKYMVINPGLEERKSKSGKSKFTVRIDAEPILVNMDPKSLGQPVAEAIARHFKERIRSIAAVAGPATLRARAVAEKAFTEGKAWATKRYSGGRIGSLPPNQTNRKFNDSGRFADSIVANASSDGAWRINVAASRLDASTAGELGVNRIWRKLLELIPEFGDSALLMNNDILRRTLESVVKDRLHKKGRMSDKAVTPFQAFAATFLSAG